MKSEQQVLTADSLNSIQSEGIDFDECKKYPLEVLQEKDSAKLPADVNPAHKEV